MYQPDIAGTLIAVDEHRIGPGCILTVLTDTGTREVVLSGGPPGFRLDQRIDIKVVAAEDWQHTEEPTT